MKQGRNDINTESNKAPPLMEGNPVRTYRMKANPEIPVKPPVKTEMPVKTELQKTQDSDTHENMKFYLFAAMSGIVGLGLYFYK